jgi:hypothetical protein
MDRIALELKIDETFEITANPLSARKRERGAEKLIAKHYRCRAPHTSQQQQQRNQMVEHDESHLVNEKRNFSSSSCVCFLQAGAGVVFPMRMIPSYVRHAALLFTSHHSRHVAITLVVEFHSSTFFIKFTSDGYTCMRGEFDLGVERVEICGYFLSVL